PWMGTRATRPRDLIAAAGKPAQPQIFAGRVGRGGVGWRPGGRGGAEEGNPATGAVVGRMDRVEDRRDPEPSPRLVDREVHPRIGVLLASDGAGVVGTDRPDVVRQIADRLHAALVGTHVERHAVAQFPGVGDLVGAVGAGVALVLGLVQRLERVVTGCAGNVS